MREELYLADGDLPDDDAEVMVGMDRLRQLREIEGEIPDFGGGLGVSDQAGLTFVYRTNFRRSEAT
jgi:hypothetical protein